MDHRKPISPTHEQSASSLSQARALGQLLDGATCLVALKDLNHRYLYANPKLESLYGVPIGGLVGSNLEAYLSFKFVSELHAREKSVIEQGVPAHFFERLVIQGKPHTWETIRFPVRDQSGLITGTGLIAIDIDESAPLTDEQREILGRANIQIQASVNPSNSTQTANNDLGLLQIQWRTNYECGNPTIDRQHLALFGQANRLLNAVLSDTPIEEARLLMTRLMGDIVQHFHDEENILRKAAYPHVNEHHQIHLQLLERASALAKQLEGGQIVLEDLFRFLAQDVISHHLLGADRDFFAFIDRHFVIDP